MKRPGETGSAPNYPPSEDPGEGIPIVGAGEMMRLIRQEEHRSVDAHEGKFTDRVWQEELLAAQILRGMRVHRFLYAPGGHSHWHSHDGEQALYAISGRGRIKSAGARGFEVGPGDVVYVPPGEEHWHGAIPDQFFVHFAFTASGETTWLSEVTEGDYEADFVP